MGKDTKDNGKKLPYQLIIEIIITIIIAYLTATWTFTYQKKSGKYLVLEISALYSYNLVNNGIDIQNRKFKDSKQDKDLYLRVLIDIENQLSSLNSNPYAISLVKKYPEIIKLRFLTCNEIGKLEAGDNLMTTGECHIEYLNLYDKVKSDLPKRLFKKGGRYYELDQGFVGIRELVNSKMREINPLFRK
ncbi:MAG: hypothetical protein ACLFVR_16170 [Thiohalospira sp.]